MCRIGLLRSTGRVLASLDGQHTLNARMFALMYNNISTQVALGFLCFGTHLVTHTSTIAFDFPGAGHFKTFLGAGVGLHFRHGKNVFFEKWSAKVR